MARRVTVLLGGLLATAACSLVVDTSDLSGGDSAPTPDASGDVLATVDATDASTTSDASPDGPCTTDLSGDPKNCGVCGHDCLGGQCVGARCQPVAVVTGETKPAGVAADATTLYWTTFGGAVRAQALDGSGAKRTITSFPSAAHLEAHDDFLYLTTYADKRVVRVAKADGAFSVLATCASECLGVCTAPAPSAVYFTDRGPQALLQANGGTGTSVSSGLLNVEDCFLAGSDVYLANENTNEVFRVPLGDPSARVTALSVADPVAVSVDANEIWVVSQSPGIIYKRALAGGALEPMATGQAYPVGLYLTPTAAYWANNMNGTIMRLAR